MFSNSKVKKARFPTKRAVGKLAEEEAERYLKGLGFEILERNFRTKVGEIDLIAKRGPLLVFVEVKCQGNLNSYFPEERIHPLKQKRIRECAEIFLLKNFQKLSKIKEIRFDVITVNLESRELKHYESAFFAE